ncbi:hypothetical protein ACFX2I_035324 [Malus domestica]
MQEENLSDAMTDEVAIPIPVQNDQVTEPTQAVQQEEIIVVEHVQSNNAPTLSKENLEPVRMETRRSTRTRKPAISNDFLVYLQEAEFSSQEEDPLNFKKAIESLNNAYWQEAMQSELDSMNKNKV